MSERELDRYSRQMLFPAIGRRGQQRLSHSQVVIIGCGALGTVMAQTLVRAGVGNVRLIDRDFIELDNLQRQVLFDEQDIVENLPKAEAAARKLRRINSAVEIEGVVADVHSRNVESLTSDADLLLDGTDNLETRFLINDVAVKLRLPWIYGAVIAAEGVMMPIFPGRGPCLRCIWEQAPPPGATPTCDTAGVLSPIVNIIASMQALEAIKLLAGCEDDVIRRFTTVDAWSGRVQRIDMTPAWERGECPCCKLGRFEYLSGERGSATSSLCGRNAVQISPESPPERPLDLGRIAATLPGVARARCNAFMLRFTIDSNLVTLFPDGRAIIKGTEDPAVARGLYARYVGS